MDKILTVNDVAEILQVKAITVREMFREKRLRGFKVGKAWRTTEAMLGEDIDALARGESPAELPTPESQGGVHGSVALPGDSTPPPGKGHEQKEGAANMPRKDAVAPAPQTAQRVPESTPKKSQTPADSPTSVPDDDTQQMLF